MSEAAPRVALYARVSTTEQSTELQVRDLLAYAERQGWAVPPELRFTDDGISGVRDNRPALDRLRALARAGKVEIVLATKLDRLGRSVGMILRFWDEADASGVRVVVTDQGIDTSTAAGRLQRTMLAAVAEFEREIILERTQAGIARVRAAGKRFGRPPKISSEQRAECLRRLSNGESSRYVSQALKIPASTVRWLWRQSRIESPPVTGVPGVARRT
jgi:putative DNA-invertase from lambdoid prophage Rac